MRRHSPRLQLAAYVAVIGSALFFVLTASLTALALVAAASVGLVVLAVTEEHRVLALVPDGIAVLAASARQAPLAQIGRLDDATRLPPAVGIGAPLEWNGRTWWIESWSYPRLRRAADLQAGERD